MSKSTPLVQEIRDRFDHFGETIGNRARTSSIKITSDRNGYAVTAYPEGTYGFEGFTIDVRAPGGIFGEQGPTRVEMSREPDELMRFNTDEVTTTEGGMTVAHLKIEPRAARENLVLPGDQGFELFDQLHSEIGARRAVVADALSTLGIVITPTSLSYTSQTTSHGSYDHKNRIATHVRGTVLGVYGTDRRNDVWDGVSANIELDGSLTGPMTGRALQADFPPEEPMVFRAGKARAYWDLNFRVAHPPVGDEALLAFAGLHANFAVLYK